MFELTNLDKIFWKKEKITKGQFIEYYEKMAPIILPYLKNRPLVLKRFPMGIDGVSFYQKEIGKNIPSFVKTFSIQHEERKINYVLVQNLKTLLFVANLAAIELHPFHSTIKNLKRPNYLIIDLDPEDVSFDLVVETALTIHEILEKISVPHFAKTSGARGMHIYLPLGAKVEFDESKNFAKILAEVIHSKIPKITSLERIRKNRQKKVYLDFLRNDPMQTVVAPYSVRARLGATVSTPLLWKEVVYGLSPLDYNIKTVPKRVQKLKDVFKKVLGPGIDIKKVLKKLDR